MLDYSRLTEQTSFVADPMPQFEVAIDIAGSVPTSEPLPFSVEHDDLRFFVATSTRLSRCLPASTTRGRWSTWDMPMGYTQLSLCEKRAIAFNGELLRLWPGPEWGFEGHLLVPDAGRPHRLGVSHPWWSVVENAVRRSGLTGGPVALVRVVDEQSWH